MRLSKKVAIVTGAAQGLGRACALAFAQEGASVVVSDINAEKGRQAAAEIASATGQETIYIETNVADPVQAQSLVDQTVRHFGRVDVLLNNAGILAAGDILSVSVEDFDRVLAVNLRGGFLIGQAAARAMVQQKIAGSIVNMSSINAVLATATQLSYAVSKGGLGQLTKAMAMGLAVHNIRVNAIGPGTINTDIIRPLLTDEAARNMMLSRTPLRRFGEPAEIAKVAVFLASDDASYITGQTIYPDGGRLALNYTVPVA